MLRISTLHAMPAIPVLMELVLIAPVEFALEVEIRALILMRKHLQI